MKTPLEIKTEVINDESDMGLTINYGGISLFIAGNFTPTMLIVSCKNVLDNLKKFAKEFQITKDLIYFKPELLSYNITDNTILTVSDLKYLKLDNINKIINLLDDLIARLRAPRLQIVK